MNILFVCTGNACRSVIAERLLIKMSQEKGMVSLSVRSCGTAASSLYRVPKQVVQFIDNEGAGLAGHKSTQVTRELVSWADLILVMENFQREYITLCFPEARKKVFLFKEYVNAEGDKEIQDPMGRSDDMYEDTANAIKEYIEKLIPLIK